MIHVCLCVGQCDENENLNRNINRNTGRFIAGRRAELRRTMSLQLVVSSVTNQHDYPGPTYSVLALIYNFLFHNIFTVCC